MLCKIIGPDGRVKMQTTSPACVPPAGVQKSMREAGYKIKIKEDKEK